MVHRQLLSCIIWPAGSNTGHGKGATDHGEHPEMAQKIVNHLTTLVYQLMILRHRPEVLVHHLWEIVNHLWEIVNQVMILVHPWQKRILHYPETPVSRC